MVNVAPYYDHCCLTSVLSRVGHDSENFMYIILDAAVVHLYVYVCMHVCMYVRRYVCVSVCM
jgi:hypothetical protein